MRIFLTGATGQLGRAIAAQLAGESNAVVGLSRQSSYVSGLSECVHGDLEVGETLGLISRVVAPCDTIVHAAATLSHQLYDSTISLTNCFGTQQVLNLAKIWRVRQVVYISSIPVIGKPRFDPITEEHPVNPLTAYHASKLYGEYLMCAADRLGIRAASFRISSPSGPGTPIDRILGTFVRRAMANEPLQLLGRGTRRQNYVDVRDVGAAVMIALNKGASGVYNIGATQSLSNYELAQACIEETLSHSTVEFLDKPDPEEEICWNVSISKAEQELGYQPRFNIRDSIRTLYNEYTSS